jgi:flagellar biosynthesis/type III secretory pathway protein FliH
VTRVLRSHAKIVSGEVFDASAEAERIRAEARRLGFEEGWQEGLAAATEAMAEARRQAREERERSEDDLRRLALSLAEKILGAQITLRPEVVRGVVEQALALASKKRRLVLRVNPEDVALLGALAETSDLDVRPDAEVGRGGCVLQDGRITVDARLETQLAALDRALCGKR